MDSLKQKAITGLKWTFLDQAGSLGISFVVGIVLARLLQPSEYGLLGMVTVFTAIATVFTDSGFGQAMVRKTDLTEEDKLTAFWFSCGMGILVYFALFISAPWVSVFYKEPQLTDILRITSIPILFSGLLTIPNMIFTREINFKVTTKISFSRAILSGMVGIYMAIMGYGVWALIVQGLVSYAIGVIMFNYYCRWKIKFIFKKNSFHYLWGFGSKMLASNLINTAYSNLYQIIIGKFYSSTDLGQYQRGQSYSGLFSNTLTQVVQRVSFPTLSKMQDDTERLKYGYRKIIKMSMLVSCLGSMALAAMAKPLIAILIGEKWLPAAEYLQIICLGALLYPVHAINLNVLTVMGRSDLFLKLEIIKKIIGTIPIVIGIFLGIKVMLWAGVVSSFLCFAINAHYSEKLINYSFLNQFKDILPFIIVSIFIAGLVYCISLLSLTYLWTIILQASLFFSISFYYYEFTNNEDFWELKRITLNFIRQKK
ncbi:lipopolysaccharide biosynthesis protein [Prevotella intermedia]|uniref:Lipopolysaccharide biosynthesis protein n=1 Tax=Prevotella intermedia TaxID=28131 RepID=A0A3R8G4Z4_PREIN|nr:lipopolysaccharide biosynthesis protein [Prevotella intermedia]RQE02077.1 lipopolysaccharide biosynthesis protein [Prevotella intermedia]RRF86697.1 lipopolysaccharide biosynthesis protein [Prevotella intermedia]